MHSAQVTKSSNAGFDPRDLDRRKFQEAAAQAIDRQAAAIQQTRAYMADLAERINKLETYCTALGAQVNQRPPARWTRLCGLLTGR